ncbi:MAG TPA: CPBP family intramembrane metalloprotease [Thermoproteales archaeon]|nr:CPBP family intramembrane metalloprotease [Thermoproteales archaeon]
MIVEVLYALILWSLVFILTIIFTSIISIGTKLSKESPWLGAVMQFGYIVFSLLVAHFLAGGLVIIGKFSFSLENLLEVSVASYLLVLTFYFITLKALKGEEYVPPFAPRNVVELVLLTFIMAPIGEEILFRGLLEGYLLAKNVNFYVSVILPAILFSLVHWVPFRAAPVKHRFLILFFALIAGLVTGYYRAVTGSITIAIIAHAIFNMPGIGRVIKHTS